MELKEIKNKYKSPLEKKYYTTIGVKAEDLIWLIEQVEKVELYEKSLEEINQLAVYYDSKGWALNPDKIGGIATKALDGKGAV